MLCENCHFNEAEVKLTVKGIDSTHEKWVCSVCAQGENPWLHSNDDAAKHGINFHEMAFKEEKKCPTCQMTLKDIAHVGKLGCADCYATFKEDIIDIVQRVQGGQFEHVGKTPQSSYKKLAIKKQIEEKSKYLNKLIDGQEFEEAAIVRDEIKALKSESEVSHDE